MKEYKVVWKIYRVRGMKYGGKKPDEFEEEINKLALEGWSVKFSNITFARDPAATEENVAMFYALMERKAEQG